MVKSFILYVFSGTGNSLKAATWIVENAINAGSDAEIHNIEVTPVPESTNISDNAILGFCYPTHGFIAPLIMLKFMWKFPHKKNGKVFFVNSRAGWSLFNVPLPGLSGLAQWWPIFLFWIKGYKTVGSVPVDLPHSWVSFFFPNPKRWEPAMLTFSKKKIDTLTSKLFNDKIYFRPQVWFSIPFDLLVVPIIPMYVLIGRVFLGKTLYASYTCDQCGLCLKYCPVNAIEKIDGRMFWTIDCESCMRCMDICPKKAIQSNITRISLILYIIFLGILMFYDLNGSIYFMFITPFFMVGIYWILHFLLRYKWFNMFFTYTSLTRYWGRYFAEGIKLKDMKK